MLQSQGRLDDVNELWLELLGHPRKDDWYRDRQKSIVQLTTIGEIKQEIQAKSRTSRNKFEHQSGIYFHVTCLV